MENKIVASGVMTPVTAGQLVEYSLGNERAGGQRMTQETAERLAHTFNTKWAGTPWRIEQGRGVIYGPA